MVAIGRRPVFAWSATSFPVIAKWFLKIQKHLVLRLPEEERSTKRENFFLVVAVVANLVPRYTFLDPNSSSLVPLLSSSSSPNHTYPAATPRPPVRCSLSPEREGGRSNQIERRRRRWVKPTKKIGPGRTIPRAVDAFTSISRLPSHRPRQALYPPPRALWPPRRWRRHTQQSRRSGEVALGVNLLAVIINKLLSMIYFLLCDAVI